MKSYNMLIIRHRYDTTDDKMTKLTLSASEFGLALRTKADFLISSSFEGLID